MEREDFIVDNENTDDNYKCYHLKQDIKIFGRKISIEDDVDIEINISVNEDIEKLLGLINEYFEYLSDCKEQLVDYILSETQEDLPCLWFEDLGIISISITVNSTEDYGAVISVDDDYLGHILELYFDKTEIEDCILVG